MNIRPDKRFQSEGDGSFRPEDFRFLGEQAVIEPGVLVFHAKHISIGANAYIGHGTVLKGYHNNEMLIGNGTWIGQGCFLHSAGGIRIGRAVGIGPSVKILTSFHRDDDAFLPVLHHPLEFHPVRIGDGADIGIGAILLPGTTVGAGAVVGAGSVVMGDVPALAVVAGIPAKILRMRG